MFISRKHLFRLIPLLIILLAIGSVFYFDLNKYLSFAVLQQYRNLLLQWTDQHYLIVVLSFIGLYIVPVALSIPGAVFLTLGGGFLFGIWWGTLYVVTGATIGATAIFMIVEFALGDWIAEKAKGWVATLQDGFQRNAFQYLLFLRLIPIFPFWVINIVPALLDVKKRTYVFATFIGIIPGSFVYVLVGNGLGFVFDQGKDPNLSIIFEPQILLPFAGLALLALVPIIYKRVKQNNESNNTL